MDDKDIQFLRGDFTLNEKVSYLTKKYGENIQLIAESMGITTSSYQSQVYQIVRKYSGNVPSLFDLCTATITKSHILPKLTAQIRNPHDPRSGMIDVYRRMAQSNLIHEGDPDQVFDFQFAVMERDSTETLLDDFSFFHDQRQNKKANMLVTEEICNNSIVDYDCIWYEDIDSAQNE